jgi:Tfp pilus assembly protein PilZ
MADNSYNPSAGDPARPQVLVGSFFDCLRTLKVTEEEAASPYGKGDALIAAKLKELKGYRDVFMKAQAPRRPRFNIIDRKADPGAIVPVEILFSSAVQFYEGLDLSLSRPGLFIKTDSLLAIDTLLEARCVIEDEGINFKMSAKVIWLNPRETQGRPAGMGLKLFRLSTIQRQLLSDFMVGDVPTSALANLSE